VLCDTLEELGGLCEVRVIRFLGLSSPSPKQVR
jgi:hypothetical protein